MDSGLAKKLVTCWRREKLGWLVRVEHQELGVIGQFWVEESEQELMFEVAYDRAISLAMQAEDVDTWY